MRPGSVIVDLAAEQGGNCAYTQPDQEALQHGVTILGPTNLPSTLAYHASMMYARTVTQFLLVLVKDGKLALNLDDELIRGPLLTNQGEIVHEAAKGK
jgi:proton-translocating NAD(P)+ transhydrogenase subunit alpha